MEDFKAFEFVITKDKMALLELEQKFKKLLEDDKQIEAFEMVKESNFYTLLREYKQKIIDWKNKVDATPVTSENIEFIKKSKQFLSQFENKDEETNELFFSKIDLLIEEKNTALKNKEFKKANLIREEIIGIEKKIFDLQKNTPILL